MNRYSEEFQKMNRKERQLFYKKRFNETSSGKYIVEVKSTVCKGWSKLCHTFDAVEDAKKFIEFYCVPNKYGTVEHGRVIHLEFIDEHTANAVIDWE